MPFAEPDTSNYAAFGAQQEDGKFTVMPARPVPDNSVVIGHVYDIETMIGQTGSSFECVLDGYQLKYIFTIVGPGAWVTISPAPLTL